MKGHIVKIDPTATMGEKMQMNEMQRQKNDLALPLDHHFWELIARPDGALGYASLDEHERKRKEFGLDYVGTWKK